ncbi:hypothetical protein I8752_12175 [Nostocaceae cyanobacterium CENA369]|uniref:ATP synthase protein MI25 n=2 Tax=Dendronalium TaxID=2840442 RepID=A0A8J7I7A8_9NOST|nr:hypothetical protein [Dendronalium phyllosphericum]MBH8573762.1 hypothetical protein [Dendronalium phyllosphericum CENA369]
MLLLSLATLLTTKVVYAAQSNGSYMYTQMNQLPIGWQLGQILLLIFIAGAFGGFISFLMNFKVTEEEISRPIEQKLFRLEQELAKQNKNLNKEDRARLEKQKRSAILKSCISQSIIGGAASPPVLMLLKPDNAFTLITMSLVVGYIGSAFFRALQERMLAYVRREERLKEQIQIQLKQQSDKIGQLIEALAKDDVKKAKSLADELKGLCASGSATFGKQSDNTYFISDIQDTVKQQKNGYEAPEGKPVTIN